MEWATPAARDAIHPGITAKDALVTSLTGATSKEKDHGKAANALRRALGTHREAASAEKTLRELISMTGDVEWHQSHRSGEGQAAGSQGRVPRQLAREIVRRT